MGSAIDHARRSDGHTVHAIKQSTTCLIVHLSELIRTIDHEVITVQIRRIGGSFKISQPLDLNPTSNHKRRFDQRTRDRDR